MVWYMFRAMRNYYAAVARLTFVKYLTHRLVLLLARP